MPPGGFDVQTAIELLTERAWESARAEMRAWCRALPDILADLAGQWQLNGTGEPAWAGYEGIAVPVTRDDHTPAVLKISFSLTRRDRENEVLARWQGRHAVRLLERDDDRHARLLERLDDSSLLDHPDPVEAMRIAGQLAAALAVAPPGGLPSMADAAGSIAAQLEESGPGPLTARDVQAAAHTHRDLGAEQPNTLLHGDLHGRNVLRSEREEWAVIDPLGEVGESALEALSPLRDRWQALPAHPSPRRALHDQLHAFADGAETSRDRVIAWTHARCVRAAVGGPGDDNGMHAWVCRVLSVR